MIKVWRVGWIYMTLDPILCESFWDALALAKEFTAKGYTVEIF